MNCVECNKELLNNAKFCRFCGAKQTLGTKTISDAPKASAISCKKCGNALTASAKFCNKCGESADNQAAISTPEPKPITIPTPVAPTPEISEQHVESIQQKPSINHTERNEQKSKSWLIPTIILSTVCLISALVYVLKFSDDSIAKQPEVASTQTVQPPVSPVTTQPEPAVVPAPPIAESDTTQTTTNEALSQQAADAEAQQKLADEEKEAARLLAVEQERVKHEEKLQKLQEQTAEKAARVEELRKAREDLAAKQQEAKLAEEEAKQAKVQSEAAQNEEVTSQPAPSAQAAFKTKFRGFLGVVVAKRNYPTQAMKDKALQIWKDEGKVLELDGSLTSFDKSSNPTSTIIKGN